MQVLVLGDSIVHGGIDNEMGGWVNRMKVISMNQNRGDHVFNLGIGGNTSTMILARAEIEIKARVDQSKNVIFSTGTNDMNKEISLNDFEDNLKKLGEIATHYGNKVFFMGLFLRTDKFTPKLTKTYDEVIQNVCKATGHTYIQTSDIITESDLIDGCHPNTQGHIKLCNRVAEFMKD